jgi:UDPglucose--hexose-1-phosphate uridylyltransferase
MSEIRQDITTNEWVIIATDRAKRPHDFVKPHKPLPPEFDPKCPFCPGNEAKTPPEVLGYRSGGAPNSPGWWIRVIPNKFAALSPKGAGGPKRDVEAGFFRKMDGVGRHEVLIESPKHNQYFPDYDDKQAEEVVIALRERYLDMHTDPSIKVVIIFKNHGEQAGTSLAHPHCQTVSTPIVPQSLRRKLAVATRYYDDNGGCLYCDIIEQEVKAGKRVVEESNHFAVFHPFASGVPFETWILPKKHSACFGFMDFDAAKDLGHVLKRNLGRIFKLLGNPDYNIVVHTAPVNEENEDYFHWHLRIIPRLTMLAGFEIGSGIFINTALPEETAAAVKAVQL